MADIARALSELRTLLGDRISTATDVRAEHARGESYHTGPQPDAVVFPCNTDEVAAIVRICASTHTPVIAFGAGTSLEGHVIPVRGGVTIDMRRMNEIVAINVEDLDATVQAGVTRLQLNDALRDKGLFFPVDPGADATLGGMAATRASGTNAVRYGTMRDNVLNLTVALADGRVIRTARRARKSAAGYDLTRLFIGSEGTLGIITELTVRLYGVPDAIAAAVCTFSTIDGAVRTVIETLQLGIPVARIELVDGVQMDAINRYCGLDYPVAPTLFIEFNGTDLGVREDAEAVQRISGGYGGSDFVWAIKQEERTKLWNARHSAYYAALALRPGGKGLVTDVCVPLSALTECIVETKRDLEDCPVPACLIGHVGDGNFHVAFVIDPDNADEVAAVEAIYHRMVQRALTLGGTCTGEHGIGIGKIDALVDELGDAVDVMRAIKSALDPSGILNPGKVLR